jgi:carboxypeptidase Q
MRLALGLAACLPLWTACQTGPRRAERLVSLALGGGESYQILRDLCTTAPHRLSGSPGAERAVEWGLETMRRMGLENVRREEVMVPRWVRGDVAKLSLPGSSEEFQITALGGSVGTPAAGVAGEVVMVRSFEELKQLGDKVLGKIVFFNRPMNPRLLNTFAAYGSAVNQRSSGPIHTARAGGIAAIVRSMTTIINDYPHTGATNYQDGLPEVPAVAISTKGAERLASLLEQGPVTLKLQLSCRTLPDVPSANVVGEIVGRKPEEIVLIGGHLDAWDIGQGAHDDGAGIAHCLEAMRLIKAAGLHPKRTIRCVLYMNEENGVRGARGYVDRHLVELERGSHYAAIESDRGGLGPRGFDTSARDEQLAELQRLVEPLRKYNMGAMIKGRDGGVDIGFLRPHCKLLFGLVPLSQHYFDYHHSDLDRVEAVNESDLALGAAAMAYLASMLADE